MNTKLSVLAALLVSATIATGVASANPRTAPATHFAGFPRAGVKASTPTTGRLLIALSPTATTTWSVYADGRIISQKWTPSGDATLVPKGARRLDTGYVQQRLTRQGVQLLRSKILATGLFEQNLRLVLGGHDLWVNHAVRRGERMVTVEGVSSPDPSWNEHFTKATPAQTRALAWIEKLVAVPARWLPARAWADSEIRAFVPARYMIAVDRSYPDLSKLPAPAREALVRYKGLRRHGCHILTTGQARALLQAFAKAGISPSSNHASSIDFYLAGLGHRPSDLHFHPALPDDLRC